VELVRTGLMVGPPRVSKSVLDVSAAASLGGELKVGRLSRRRTFRSPHHSASMPALAGGGLRAKPRMH